MASDTYATETASANMIKSAQQILAMVADVKQALLLNDYDTLNKGMRNRMETINVESDSINTKLKAIKQEIDAGIEEIRSKLLTADWIGFYFYRTVMPSRAVAHALRSNRRKSPRFLDANTSRIKKMYKAGGSCLTWLYALENKATTSVDFSIAAGFRISPRDAGVGTAIVKSSSVSWLWICVGTSFRAFSTSVVGSAEAGLTGLGWCMSGWWERILLYTSFVSASNKLNSTISCPSLTWSNGRKTWMTYNSINCW